MTLGAHIAGYVLGLDNSLGNVDINVFNADGHPIADGPTGQILYETGAVPSGDYRVRFDATQNPPPCAGPFEPQYYNRKPTWAQADLVHVSVPHTTLDINALFWSARLFLPILGR